MEKEVIMVDKAMVDSHQASVSMMTSLVDQRNPLNIPTPIIESRLTQTTCKLRPTWGQPLNLLIK